MYREKVFRLLVTATFINRIRTENKIPTQYISSKELPQIFLPTGPWNTLYIKWAQLHQNFFVFFSWLLKIL